MAKNLSVEVSRDSKETGPVLHRQNIIGELNNSRSSISNK